MVPLYQVFMPENLHELKNILYSGRIAYGDWGKKFEKSVSDFIDNEKFLAVNSYNSAMLVAIAALGLKPGDQVIASPMSCLASNQPLVTQNLEVIWADIDPGTGTLDPEDVRKRITEKTRVIFHNHHCGYIGYVEEIKRIADEYGVFVVDDAIEAFGSEYNNRRMGNLFADITVFSFQTVRLPNTVDGGGIAFRKNDLYERGLHLRDLGIDRRKFRNSLGEISVDYDISVPGFGATLSEVNSYIGYAQMDEIKNLFRKQRENAENWSKELSQSKLIKPLRLNPSVNPNYWVYGCLTEDKSASISQFRERGFYASGVHLPNNYYSIFGDRSNLKGVDSFHRKFIALPSGWWIDKNTNLFRRKK